MEDWLYKPSGWTCGLCDFWDDVNGCWLDIENVLCCLHYGTGEEFCEWNDSDDDCERGEI